MAKTAKKREEKSAANVRRRLSAALVMLLISAVMLITSTYAWFTLSTAPEVRGIDTSVAGNGSLEIALMPTNGLFSSIGTGRNASGTYGGGTQVPTVANSNWGNIVNLSDTAYGLDLITLKPAKLNVVMIENKNYTTVTVNEGEENEFVSYVDSEGHTIQHLEGENVVYDDDKTIEDAAYTSTYTPSNSLTNAAHPFSIPEFGYDGRITELKATDLASHYTDAQYTPDASGFGGSLYGVRAIVDELGDTYGYVVDLALRLNTVKDAETAGKLLLQVAGAQRVYSDSSANATQGGGSNLWFQDDEGNDVSGAAQTQASEYLKAIRIAFIQNLGNANGAGTESIIAYARANLSTGDLYLCDAAGEARTGADANVILAEMIKNTAYQISAVVWLDGEAVTNANMAVTTDDLSKATLNLQFATDVALVPAQNTNLKENPPAPVTEAPENNTPAEPTYGKTDLQAALTEAQPAYTAAAAVDAGARTEEQTALITLYDTIQTGLAGTTYNEYSSAQFEALIGDLQAAVTAANP